jgi:two-component system, LuxR family, sensor kinase FixL
MSSSSPEMVQLALQESAARLSAILNTAVEGIITIDEFGKIESANASAQSLFGYTEAEMIGQNVSMLMPEPYRSQHDGYLSHHCRTGEKKIIGIGREVVGQRKCGTVFPMDLSVSEVVLPGRRLFTGFVRDVSVRKQQEERLLAMASSLEAKNKELESIVHVASHDLRAPLVNIHGFSQELVGACRNWNKLVENEPMPHEVREKLSSLIQEEVAEPLEFILASVTKIDRLLGACSA